MKKTLLLALALAAACADAAPAYYRQQIGDLRVTALFDGTLHLPRGDIKNIPAEDVAKLLADSSANEDEGGILASVNAFLIERGDEKVLVDSGTADCFATKPDKLGQVPEALAAAGINAADIKNILLTHGHSDHLCGLINADGSATYPNATVWINAAENRYWHSDAEKAKLPEKVHFLFDQARGPRALRKSRKTQNLHRWRYPAARRQSRKRQRPHHRPQRLSLQQRPRRSAAGLGRPRSLPRHPIRPPRRQLQLRL